MDAPEALREFLMYVVANLIEHPQQASIAIGTTQSGAISYRILLAPEDVRRVVGRNGFTISAIRSLVNVAAQKHGVRVVLRVDSNADEVVMAPATATNSEGAQNQTGNAVQDDTDEASQE